MHRDPPVGAALMSHHGILSLNRGCNGLMYQHIPLNHPQVHVLESRIPGAPQQHSKFMPQLPCLHHQVLSNASATLRLH